MITGSLTIHRLLQAMCKLQASDLHIKVGIPPTFRINGLLKAAQADPISEEEADHLFDAILNEDQKQRYIKNRHLDMSWHLPEGDRFRINLFSSGSHTHAAIRRVNAIIPSYDQLHLPEIYSKLVTQTTEGLILVVGTTGSGKSTTLAAMVDQVNSTRSTNIVTIEDPVEYQFFPKVSIISQREIGIDVDDFRTALRSVVREDPDVIFIGEMRDHETVLAAIQAAETGHLVFATLHTADVMQSFGRMLEFFPQQERDFIRSSLSACLKAVLAQKLLPALESSGAGIVPVTEILINNTTVREKIREGYDEDLPSIIGTSSAEGMRSFNMSLAELVTDEKIAMALALDHSPNREALASILKGVQVKQQGLVSRLRG